MTDNEGRLRGEVGRGDKAASILRNDIYEESFRVLRTRYIEELVSSSAGEAEKRDRLYHAIRVLENVKQHIESVAKTGEMAQVQLNELFKRR